MTRTLTSPDLHPCVPRDPLAAAEGAGWAEARHRAVASLPLDDREREVLQALEQLAQWLDGQRADATAALVSRRQPTEELPAAHVLEALSADLPPDDLPDDVAEAIELSADEIDEAPEVPVVQGSSRQLASAETIVLSGPEIRRKIRHKQSIMPSYVAQMLYEDIGALFEIGDRDGALVSLERLLTVAPLTPQIEAFLVHNEQRLLDYYESTIGPWSRSGRLRRHEIGMPDAYFRLEKVAAVAAHLDGQTPLSDAIARCGLRPIEACAVLSQLSRSSSLQLSPKA